MFLLDLLSALFLDGCVKALRLHRDPDYRAMNRKAWARRDALVASIDDTTDAIDGDLFPTFRQHHALARARRGVV